MRILQLIGDTDSSVANLAALDLHHRLAAAGREVRTLALAPGRATPLRLLGQSYALAKDDARALAYFQTYLERAKADPVEIDHIADVRQHVATLSKQK